MLTDQGFSGAVRVVTELSEGQAGGQILQWEVVKALIGQGERVRNVGKICHLAWFDVAIAGRRLMAGRSRVCLLVPRAKTRLKRRLHANSQPSNALLNASPEKGHRRRESPRSHPQPLRKTLLKRNNKAVSLHNSMFLQPAAFPR